MKTTTTWRRNFRRWSVQLAAALTALGGIELIGHAAQAVHTTLPLWEPILPAWAFALLTTIVSISIGVTRNLPQEGHDD